MKNSIKILDKVKIKFKNKNYEIDIDKILYVLSALSDKKLNKNDVKIISKLMKKFKLFDEMFLKSIQNL